MSENDRLKNTAQPSGGNDTSDNSDWLEIEDEGFEDLDESEEFLENNEILEEENNAHSKNLRKKNKSKKKSSLPSLTSLGLIALAGGGGYYYYASMLTSAPPKNVSSEVPVVSLESEVTNTNQDTDLPIQTQTTASTELAPIEQVPDEQKSLDLASLRDAPPQPPTLEESQGILTPMPNTSAMENVELAPLEGESSLQAPSATPELVDHSAETLHDQLTETLALNDSATPSSPETPPIGLDTSEKLKESELIEQTEKKFVEEPPVPAENISVTEQSQTAAIVIPETTATPVEPEPQNPAKTIIATEDLEPVTVPEEKLVSSTNANDMKSQTESKAETTSAEKPVSNPPVNAAPAPTEIKKVPQEPAKEIVKTPETTKPATPAVAETPAVPKKKESPPPAWKLRSASPGSAVIFDPATGNMQTVETGDRIAGIGRIKSIALVNGKWLVQGSSGSIHQ